MIIDIHAHVSAPPERYAYQANMMASRAPAKRVLKLDDEIVQKGLKSHLRFLEEARTDMQSVIEHRITTAKTVALRAVREWIRGRQAELRTSITELNEQMGRDAATRDRAVAEAHRRNGDIEEILRTCDNYLSRLARSMGNRSVASR